jgi:hypothetical protein
MADLPIYLLPSGAGNMLSTDRFPIDKFNGGPYITVYRTGQEIMNSITSLSTISFININTSINNVQNNIVPTINTYQQLLEVRQLDILLSSGSSSFITFVNINTLMSLDTPYIINIKIFAMCETTTIATRIKEITMTYVNKSTPESLGLYSLYDYADTNGSNITIGNPTISSINNIRISCSHSIVAENVKFSAVVTIHKGI